MLRKKEDEKYFKIAVTGVAILLIGMVCFFLFYRIRGFGAFFHDLIGILEPFIYGFVIAYVLRPTCRWWEKELRKLLVRAHVKHAQGIASALAITFCELLTLTIVTALFMLVIPQVITSILSLVSVLPDQLDNSNKWLHDMLEKYPTMQQSWVDPDAEEITDKAHSLAEKNVWARISIIAAGPIFNFLLAFVLAVIVIGFAGSDKPYVQGVIDKYPAQEAGLEKGDLITSVNGSRVHLFREIQIYMAMNPGKSLDVTYVRDNQTHETTLVPKYDEANNTYYMGIYSGARYGLKWYETLQYGLYEVKYNVVTVIKSLGMIFTGDLPMTSFSGPVGIATTVNDMVEEVNTSMADESFSDRAMTMFLTLANFVVMISANLGVMNLLPIPALDGGRLLFLLIEAVRGKPVPKEKEAIVHIAGIIFLFIFMIFILFSDIIKIFQ